MAAYTSPYRNYKCRIREIDYRGVRQVNLDNELLHVAVLAGKGSDICEFLYKPLDLDFMWHSFNPVQAPTAYAPSRTPAAGTFLPLYEGGWQELFPSYGAPAQYKGAEYGLHGEVAVVPWEYRIETDNEDEVCVYFWVRTPSTPYLLEKWLTLKSGQAALHIRERVTNESPVPMEFMWGHHPVLGPPFLDESCRIRLPEGTRVRTLASPGALEANSSGVWPLFPLAEGGTTDLSTVNPEGKRQYREYGIEGLKQGSCTVWNDRLAVGLELDWDVECFPFLWIWEPNGGLDTHPWYGRNHALGVEPWSHLAGGLEEVLEQGNPLRLEAYSSRETALCMRVTAER